MPGESDQAVKQSLITRSGIALVVLVFISVVNMLVTFLSAENAENDAVRINIAGSLRMQSYRIAETAVLEHSEIVYDRASLEQQLAEFERRFYLPVLSLHILNTGNDASVAAYRQLEQQWFGIKQLLQARDDDLPAVLVAIDSFVLEIDKLVKMLELQTENKLKLLRTLQGISMLVTIIVVSIILMDLNNTVVEPLRQLVAMAKKVHGGDFSMRLHVGREDELALLSDTLNMMASSLDAMYRDLENKVQEKTRYLEQARDQLGLLYETSRLLAGSDSIQQRLKSTLAAVQHYFGAVQARIELSGAELASELAVALPPATSPQRPLAGNSSRQHRFAIERLGETRGELVVSMQQHALSGGQQRILQLLADNIAAALSAESRHEQQHRLVLMEERAVIARELHDSLAQTLSYLKIQISRLQMLQAKGADQQQLDATVEHIKRGINAAYVQLRELLSTFRLQLSSQGLRAALQATVVEFAERGSIDIELDYRLDDCRLTPNEEIHVLQIVREALSNVLRHSRAQHARVCAFLGADQAIEVGIHDDGVGFSPQQSRDNHYGKIIMRERAQTLKGSIRFDNARQRGAVVILRFVPDIIARAANIEP